ncbi:MAG: glycosyltransferase [Thermoplasmata archaeon]
MRILHLNNVANVAVELRDAQRQLGHEARVASLVERATWLNFPEDYRFYPGRGLIEKIAFAGQLLNLVRWADVVHVHGTFSNLDVLRTMRNLGKTMVAHYHGTDVRLGSWRSSADLFHAILLSTPDLQEACPSGVYVPNPLTPLEAPPRHRPEGPFRVVHAHVRHAALEKVKGTETIRRILAGIDGAELVEVVGKSHGEALAIYASCDLAVDQLRIGWYGMFALECMSMGIPTLGYVEDPNGLGNPVYPVEDGTLRETIEAFLRDEALRHRVAEKQGRYVREVHDPLTIGRRVLEVYEGRP